MKPSTKMRRRLAREKRWLEWAAARASFLLAGGHKQYIAPFHMNWRYLFVVMEADIASGRTTYTQPNNGKNPYYGHWQIP